MKESHEESLNVANLRFTIFYDMNECQVICDMGKYKHVTNNVGNFIVSWHLMVWLSFGVTIIKSRAKVPEPEIRHACLHMKMGLKKIKRRQICVGRLFLTRHFTRNGSNAY